MGGAKKNCQIELNILTPRNTKDTQKKVVLWLDKQFCKKTTSTNNFFLFEIFLSAMRHWLKPMRSCENSRKQLHIFCSFQIARTPGLMPSQGPRKIVNTFSLPKNVNLMTKPIQLAHDKSILPPASNNKHQQVSSHCIHELTKRVLWLCVWKSFARLQLTIQFELYNAITRLG